MTSAPSTITACGRRRRRHLRFGDRRRALPRDGARWPRGRPAERGFSCRDQPALRASGYYVEGPYYHRFAIRPLLIFAEALQLHRPELDIYNHNDQTIRRTIKALLATTYPNGCLPALNDALAQHGHR